jgi:hypothetical protein
MILRLERAQGSYTADTVFCSGSLFTTLSFNTMLMPHGVRFTSECDHL